MEKLVAKEAYYYRLVNHLIEQAIHRHMTINERKLAMIEKVTIKQDRLETAFKIFDDEDTIKAFKRSKLVDFTTFLFSAKFPSSETLQDIL